MWADCVTVHQLMGCSPYFAVTGTHPLLPLDIAEATYLLPPPDAPMSTTALIANRAIALQKRRTHLVNLATNVKLQYASNSNIPQPLLTTILPSEIQC